ncbi:MAG: polysaccharide deacetylase family protein [Candidatus Zixiibacteriota bacterium]
MKHVTPFLLLFTLVTLLATTAISGDRQIAITFNELPAAPSFEDVHADALNYLILDGLKKYNVKATGFVVGANITEYADVLGQWLNAGHFLGSMTYDNQDINEVTPSQFKEEVVKGVNEIEGMLDGFGQKKRYFRFPFHKYGTTAKAKSDIKDFIRSHGEVICPATIIPEDFIYNSTLAKLGKMPDSSRLIPLRDEYLNHVFDIIEQQEQIAEKLVGHSVKQIILLQVNRLNAIFLDDLLGALKDHGYKFITLDSALTDEVYSRSESYTGTRGLGWLEMLAKSKR